MVTAHQIQRLNQLTQEYTSQGFSIQSFHDNNLLQERVFKLTLSHPEHFYQYFSIFENGSYNLEEIPPKSPQDVKTMDEAVKYIETGIWRKQELDEWTNLARTCA